jgi:toxin ParE1/3/4
VPGKPLKVRWLKRALANLEAEAEYIFRDSHAAAQRVVLAIEQAVQLLASHPAMGRAGRVEGTRELVVTGTPYIIPYRVREDRVEVLRVFHAARKWPPNL